MNSKNGNGVTRVVNYLRISEVQDFCHSVFYWQAELRFMNSPSYNCGSQSRFYGTCLIVIHTVPPFFVNGIKLCSMIPHFPSSLVSTPPSDACWSSIFNSSHIFPQLSLKITLKFRALLMPWRDGVPAFELFLECALLVDLLDVNNLPIELCPYMSTSLFLPPLPSPRETRAILQGWNFTLVYSRLLTCIQPYLYPFPSLSLLLEWCNLLNKISLIQRNITYPVLYSSHFDQTPSNLHVRRTSWAPSS